MLHIPAATDRFDQQNAGVELTTHEIDVVALVGKGDSLRSDHFEIEFETALVARLEGAERFERCSGRAMLLLLFRLQYAQCGKIILYLFECLQCCLPISRNGSVIAGASLLGERAAPAAIKEAL